MGRIANPACARGSLSHLGNGTAGWRGRVERMTTADVRARDPEGTPGLIDLLFGSRKKQQAASSAVAPPGAQDATAAAAETRRERFIPVTRFALFERLSQPLAWSSPVQAGEARRFFRYLDYWRQQQYNAELMEIEQLYEPFSPDSDLLMTRQFTADEKLRAAAPGRGQRRSPPAARQLRARRSPRHPVHPDARQPLRARSVCRYGCFRRDRHLLPRRIEPETREARLQAISCASRNSMYRSSSGCSFCSS